MVKIPQPKVLHSLSYSLKPKGLVAGRPRRLGGVTSSLMLLLLGMTDDTRSPNCHRMCHLFNFSEVKYLDGFDDR
jgi:hypothetical protein